MRKGFTLIELIVVIAIIAVLAAIIAPNAFRAIEKAKMAQIVSNFKTIKSASLSYYADVGSFPPNDDCYGLAYPHEYSGIDFFENKARETIESGYAGWVCFPLTNNYLGWDGPYLESWPSPPWTSGSARSQFQYQGGWADFNNDGVMDESVELHFWYASDDFAEEKFSRIDKAIDDDNISTGNYISGATFDPLVGGSRCTSCSFYKAALN
ncbi:MAG: prepilin-type N-terminal cleavage/methylation domain-containing protein [Candidatus Omnitrophica bacterium]|nr:prepilin-type N-terminal cleavage/methylation domain-containing protein [Candidatus Omnitrophota bacterium]MBU2043716.1 prepilin-type N-terminal cleavage/methylation domain-containing protein [Candidatus Omnitrophota bacterium]MBU2265994.1 prepilin-type N-terminal cleavage/methylation domain-containing protein [Candidatus Omnitrophota bacterium]MBU2474026.1 prepilin-type N-terminal cleavage/methylation domain-containing protein [Candidatus Omnitrophota bacterium]